MSQVEQEFIDGVGGLRFIAQSPPGLGRLVRVPFYLQAATAGYNNLVPDGGIGPFSSVSPFLQIAAPAADGVTATATLRTPQVSWSLLRFVGFETHIYYPQIPGAAVMDVCFSTLRIEGGTSIFVHDDFGSGSMYLTGSMSAPGFRDYPLVESPNRMQVSVQGIGRTTSAATAFTCCAVFEILQDDTYGSHIPGPYARKDAIKNIKTIS